MKNLSQEEMVELLKLVKQSQQEIKSSLLQSVIGKYVIIRSYNEGVNCGVLEAADETGCVLRNARRLYYHKPADSNTSWYEGVAETGVSNDSKLSSEVSQKYIIEKYSVTVCSTTAEKSLKNHIASKS